MPTTAQPRCGLGAQFGELVENVVESRWRRRLHGPLADLALQVQRTEVQLAGVVAERHVPEQYGKVKE